MLFQLLINHLWRKFGLNEQCDCLIDWIGFIIIDWLSIDYRLQLMINLLPYVQSCLNPLIYGFMSKNFRKNLRRVFNSCCRPSPRHKRFSSVSTVEVVRMRSVNGRTTNGKPDITQSCAMTAEHNVPVLWHAYIWSNIKWILLNDPWHHIGWGVIGSRYIEFTCSYRKKNVKLWSLPKQSSNQNLFKHRSVSKRLLLSIIIRTWTVCT